MNYYDPMFYICSEEMPFTIRIEFDLFENVDGAALRQAVNTAIKRYPYFSVQLEERDGELVLIPNEREIVVRESAQPVILGSREFNYHLVALTWQGREISFHASHVITDGAGCYPFFRSILYYYFCAHTGKTLDPHGFRLSEEPFYPDELGNPFPEEAMAAAEPLYVPKERGFFRLKDGGYVNDRARTVYRVDLSEKELLKFGRDNDGSPCAVVSSLMTLAIWDVHPELREDIVSAVSFNLRPGLGNGHSYRLLCSSLGIRYPVSLRDDDIIKLNTCTRGAITLLSQPENVLAYAQTLRQQMEALLRVPGVDEKTALLAPRALKDATDNTFSVSYVGPAELGEIEPYIDSIYNYTDGSTYETLFLEIANLNDEFDIAFLQGFSSDVYFRAFLRQLELHDLSYTVNGCVPPRTPGIELPGDGRFFVSPN